MNNSSSLNAVVCAILLTSVLALPLPALAQTRVEAPKNPYSVAKDVELGQQAARQAERQLPVLNDRQVQSYVDRVGQRLAEAIPAEFRHPEFRYSYTVVDLREINAFALPGGFTYVNRGLIEAAQNEAQLAGVLAHEISHVALRHGTAQAAKAQKYQVGSILGQIAGAVIGGGAGAVVGGLSQFGVGVAFLRFSREYERHADTLGAQIMANSGYDPRELANMFRIIERQGGGGGPEFMSDHPNPGNRYEAINREAQMLRVADPIRNTGEFNRVQARLRDMPRARSMQDATRGNRRYQEDPRDPNDNSAPQLGRVDFPSGSYRAYAGGNLFRIAVPDNWRELGGGNEITFAPEGAYGQLQGQFVFTHGVQVGITNPGSRYLRQATDQFIQSLAQGNPNLRRNSSYVREAVGGREGISMVLSNVSDATGQAEIVAVVTTMLRNGQLFYLVAVAPQNEYGAYQGVFRNIVRSVSINN